MDIHVLEPVLNISFVLIHYSCSWVSVERDTVQGRCTCLGALRTQITVTLMVNNSFLLYFGIYA